MADRVTVPGGGSDPLARALAAMAAYEPDGFPMCCECCPVSYVELVALYEEVAGLREQLAETEAERDGSQFLKECAEAALLKKEHEAEALRVERDTAVDALREIVRVAQEPLDSMRSERRTLRYRGQTMLDIAREALAAVGGQTG